MHISVSICTYQRPALLKRLLTALSQQETKGEFSYSVVICDNDEQQSAKEAVNGFIGTNLMNITYCVEPRRSISLARNKTLEFTRGELIAFIDDDEFPTRDWLLLHFNAIKKYKVGGVFGPVKPHFDSAPPSWIKKGGFFERPVHITGYPMVWQECRTGNVLICSSILEGLRPIFDPKFGAGASDIDLFRRLMLKGNKFIWCNEAAVYEVVSPNRWKRRFMIKRSLLRGRISLLHPKKRLNKILKSLVAVPAYCFALPFMQLFGHHFFMKYLIKLCDHAGRLLALIGLNPIHEREM